MLSIRAAAIAVGIFLCLSNGVHSFGTGPPPTVCTALIPTGHTGTDQASDSPGGFYIYTELLNDGNAGAYNADQSYDVLLGSPSGTQFRGFLIQARNQTSGDLLGSFTISDTDNFQFLTCSGNAQATVVHRNNNLKTSAAFEWTAPSTAGTVEFRYTVVITNTVDYYANLNAADNRPPVSFFPTQLGEHLFSFGIPTGCSGTSCSYFVGLSPNMDNVDYLDVYLDGVASGWIAIGFSTDMNMGNDDVLGCRVNSNMVTAVDTRNPSGTNPNMVDDDQSDLATHFGNFENGRITCSFSRLIEGSSASDAQDFNLNNSFIYFYGRRLSDQGSTTNLASHRVDNINPDRSTALFNPTTDAFIAPVNNQSCPTAPGSNAVYSFQFQTPSDSYYLAARVNPSDNTYLDIRLEGDAGGWVGVGFSDEREMRSDDVLGCIRDATSDDVFVVDTYNPSTRYGSNTRDPDQSGVCPHTTSFTDGRISCTFSRLIQAIGDSDRNLNQDWFLFFATSSQRGSSLSSLPRHSTTPDISASRANIVTDNGVTDPVNNQSLCPTAPGSNAVYSFQFQTPSDSYYLAARVNPSDNTYLDIRLEGDADGWVGVGFSDEREMRNDDVLGCIRDSSSDDVFVVDTYNPSTRYAANTLDPDQSGVCPHTTSFTDGRISCTFSRLIQATDNSDRNLNQDWFFFFATSNMRGSSLSSLPQHSRTPDISASRANIVEDVGFNAPVNNQSLCPTAPDSDAVYSFQFQTPSDSYYLATRVNPSDSTYLDIRLEGDANGWVGVGFSDEREMRNDDVLGCIRDATSDNVFVVDTYNPSTRYAANTRDPDQSGVCPHTTSFTDGRISCTFSRLIQATDNSDRDLNQDWFLFFATSSQRGSSLSSLPQHSTVPDISASSANIVEDESVGVRDFPREELLKVHGILMIITWPLMVVVAIFFAAWMKPALPNGEWFQVHRVLMVVALFVGAAGFIFAFVANADNATPGLISFACGENRTHFALGIIVFLLQIVNPIIAIFRCSPKGKNRWIFNLTHGNLIGLVAELLALTNIGIGIALLEAGGCNLQDTEFTILWVYIAFVIFLLILQVVLFIIFTLLAFTAEPEKRAGLVPSMMKYFFTVKQVEKPLEMSDPSAKSEKPSNDPPPRKPPSQDSPLRWVFFLVLLSVILALMLACIILIIIN